MMTPFPKQSFTIFLILFYISVSQITAFPVSTEDALDATDSILLSALHKRLRREATPQDTPQDTPLDEPEVAAHLSGPIYPRNYGYVRPAVPIVHPLPRPYYNNPFQRIYVRIPYSTYYRPPKSELFEMDEITNGYINNLLPIFKEETPNAKVDPVAANPPAVPSAPVAPNVVDPFPFFTRQASRWMWPDGIMTGALPQINVVRSQPFSLDNPLNSLGNAQTIL